MPLFLEGAEDGSEAMASCVLTVAETKTDILLVLPRHGSHLWRYSSLSCHPRVWLRQISTEALSADLRHCCFIWCCQIVNCGTALSGAVAVAG